MGGKTALRLSVIVGVAFFFLAVSMLITGAVLPRWMELFGLSATRAGRLFSLYYLPYVVTTFVSGALCDLFGKKPILVASQLFLALGFFVVSLAEHFSTIEWGIFLAGIGGGFCEAPLTGLLSQVFPGREGYALNLSQISFGLGAAVGPYLAGFLLEKNVSFRVLYFVPGVFSVLLFGLLARERELFAFGNSERFSLRNLRLLAPWKVLLGASFLAIFLYVGAEIGSSAWMSTYFVRELKQGLYLGGAAMGIFWGMMTVGRLIFGILTRRISYLALLRVAAVLSFLALLGLTITRQVPLALSALLVLGFGFAPIWPLIVAWVAKHINELQATAIGLTVASGGLGALFFPWFMGVVADSFGLRWVFLVALVLVAGLFLMTQSRFFRGDGRGASWH
ncbi:MAG: MFS transporter [Candidatus Caldatribacterium sp.]|nr:MFS transporter [Candidatus Caldatribacterium sp.]